ncbi:hypothetical protein [Fortiea contorta]|uniref:hypothetical protein n=1 Tax=Fortiea contorta TaxID=1892405 RepID=UPI00034C0232|nr:hypothetical protein [Fortiea contorta]
MQEPKLTHNQLTQTQAGNTIQITLDSKQDTLPQPSKASTTLGDVVFRSLLSAFTSALLTQTISLLPLPKLTDTQLASVAVGLAVFGVGLESSLKRQMQPKSVVYGSAVVAGVLLGL